jgi:hypothetical protein
MLLYACMFLHYIVQLCCCFLLHGPTIGSLLDSLPTLATSVTTHVHSFDADPHTARGCVVTALGSP